MGELTYTTLYTHGGAHVNYTVLYYTLQGKLLHPGGDKQKALPWADSTLGESGGESV